MKLLKNQNVAKCWSQNFLMASSEFILIEHYKPLAPALKSHWLKLKTLKATTNDSNDLSLARNNVVKKQKLQVSIQV